MKKIFPDQKGFALLNVVFLTVITAFAAMILLNAVPRAKNPQATLNLTAQYVANEQFAQLESLAASNSLDAGSYSFLGKAADLTTENAGAPIKFTVTTTVTTIVTERDENLRKANENLRKVTVKVEWTFGGKNFELKSERTMRVVPPS